MEYLWQDKDYRQQFSELPKTHPEDFKEYCNLLISDMNNMLLEGILALESIKDFEEIKEEPDTWNALP